MFQEMALKLKKESKSMKLKMTWLLFSSFIYYTESEQVCKFNDTVPLGITHSKQLCFRKPAKNGYKSKK
jgi:hypothetical protein